MRKLAWILATWFGCGLVPIAPGTAGTLGALPVYFALRGHGPDVLLAAAFALALAGVWAGGVVAREDGGHDPQVVVIDEVAGVLVTLAFAPAGLLGTAAGVILFRLFDITKPWPCRAAERFPGGWGIVADDIVAGVWAAVVLVGLRTLGVLG